MTSHDAPDSASPMAELSRRSLIAGAGASLLTLSPALGREGEAAPVPTSAFSPVDAAAPNAVANMLVLAISPRVPLAGISDLQLGQLLSGSITNWAEVGCPVSIPLEPLAMSGAESSSIEAVAVFPDYNALADAMWNSRGAMALVPLGEVDCRVAVPLINGQDPLVIGDPADPAIRVGVIGDVLPGRNVHNKMAAYGDFTRPFLRVAPLLRSFDLTVANLEGNISDTIPQPTDPHAFSFVSNTAMLEGFKLAGIDAVTLANNHSVWSAPSENWGLQGILDTMAALDTAGIPFFGAGYTIEQARKPWIADVNGTTIAWLGIDGVTANYEVAPGQENGVLDYDAGATMDRPGTNPYLSEQFLADIAAATQVADVVIPYFHMGAEYVAVIPEWAQAGARAAIDAGAAMVVTNHPHVIQGMEIYRNKPIVYSVGNFIIDQMWGVEVRSGYILEILIRDNRVIGLHLHPTEIEDFHQARLMNNGERANLLGRFWTSTDRLAARGG